MAENFDNNHGNMSNDYVNHSGENHSDDSNMGQNDNNLNMRQNDDTDINSYSMDMRGDIRADNRGTAVVEGNLRTYIILGWVSAALSAFVSPYFAILGIVLGVLANRKERGSGAAIIATNVMLGVLSFLFRIFLWNEIRRMMTGY